MPAAAAYFLDFDHTLFDTDGFFHVDLRTRCLRLGIDATAWEQSYARVRQTGYTLDKHVEEIGRRSNTRAPLDGLEDLLHRSFSDLSRYVFPDVRPFLEEGRRLGVTLYLLSFGDPDWQRYKVSSSGVGEYFDDMFFVTREGGKGALILEEAKAFDRVVMVDNDPVELDAIKDLAPAVRTYWINRVPDEMLEPRDEPSRVRFLEARRYVGMARRHQHIDCRTLDDLAGR